jgi:signal transduction histidine kinase
MIDLRKAPPELFAHVLENNLQGVGPVRKLYGHFLDAVRLRLTADCVWIYVTQGEGVETRIVRGEAGLCDEGVITAFRREERPQIPRTMVLAWVTVHGRQVALVGAARRGRELGQSGRRTLDRLCCVLAGELARREEERLARVLDRIRGKIVSELRPRDLAYQILDGLHQLVDYDHSSAFLTYDPSGVFRIEAEKMVWTKGKSAFVGHEIPVTLEQVAALSRAPEIRSFIETDGEAGGEEDSLRDVLDHHRGHRVPTVSSLLCAPLFFGGEFLGLLKVASWKRRSFDRRDLAVVERFLPSAAVSIRNARVNMSLERQAIQSEMKATLVTLASAVAHDVNNAVGTILPLAQQVREDLCRGDADLETLEQDLALIEEKARLCQRIFSNMLRVARSGRAGDGPVDLNQVVRETLPFLQGQAGRQGVEIVLDLASDLPAVRFSRNDLQHIVLNLVSNSLEAMEERGGRVVISTREDGEGGAQLLVADDGPGINPELLERVQEPFFSTRNGTGLGLAIVRSLAWQNGGAFEIASAPGEGTRVTVGLRLTSGAGEREGTDERA